MYDAQLIQNPYSFDFRDNISHRAMCYNRILFVYPNTPIIASFVPGIQIILKDV